MNTDRNPLLGALAGDIIGSTYEFNPVKRDDFELFPLKSTFTDDSVLTIAVADVLVNNADYAVTFKRYTRNYPGRGYGGRYIQWALSESANPYNSYGNGSAMRVSPVGFFFNSEEDVLVEAARSAIPTHNHPEGVKGAQAAALAVFYARQKMEKEYMRAMLAEKFGYNLSHSLDSLRPSYVFDETCQGTLPAALIAFFDANGYEDAIRKAVSLGGDADTLACITGAIAGAYYDGVPLAIAEKASMLIPKEFLTIMQKFEQLVNKKATHSS